MIPIILAYTGYAYWVFRGKTGRRGLPLSRAPRQWLWFVGLWAAGVAVTALVGYGIKLWLKWRVVTVTSGAVGRQLKASGRAVPPNSRSEARSSRAHPFVAVSA